MQSFEIHITGSKNIIEVLKIFNIKSLHVEQRNPKNETVDTEYMSSHITEFKNYEDCKKWTDEFVFKLKSNGVEIYRIKIECPYFYSEYKEQSIYIESHFKRNDLDLYPFVYNVNSNKYVSTDRVYLKSEYDSFIKKWQYQQAEIEYCLFDDNIRHDIKWIESFS